MRRASPVVPGAQSNLDHVIASLRGEIVALTLTSCVIDVGGVGYAVAITPRHSHDLTVGDTVTLVTTLIVREDAMQLYGFHTAVEQELFDALLTVSGVGPRSAMAVLAALSPNEVYVAVATEDDSAFRKVTGIGPKTAKLIVVSLAGKLAAFQDGDDFLSSSASKDAQANDLNNTVIQALVGLGWNEKTVRPVVADIVSKNSDAQVSVILRDALGALSSSTTPASSSRGA